MTTITITISIDSEGQVQVGPTAVTTNRPQDPYEAAQDVFADELVPLPPEPGFRGSATAQAPAQAATGGFCPVHGQAWRVVPAGISKKTGKAYDAFMACPTKGCNERPR